MTDSIHLVQIKKLHGEVTYMINPETVEYLSRRGDSSSCTITFISGATLEVSGNIEDISAKLMEK